MSKNSTSFWFPVSAAVADLFDNSNSGVLVAEIMKGVLSGCYSSAPIIFVINIWRILIKLIHQVWDKFLKKRDLHFDNQVFLRSIAPPVRKLLRWLLNRPWGTLCLVTIATSIVIGLVGENPFVIAESLRLCAIFTLTGSVLASLWSFCVLRSSYERETYHRILRVVVVANHAGHVIFCDDLLWFLHGWVLVVAQMSFFGFFLAMWVTGWWCTMLRDSFKRSVFLGDPRSERALNSLVIHPTRPPIRPGLLFFRREMHSACFKNVAGDDIRVSMQLPQGSIPTVRDWRAALASKHFVVPSHRWVLLVDDATEVAEVGMSLLICLEHTTWSGIDMAKNVTRARSLAYILLVMLDL